MNKNFMPWNPHTPLSVFALCALTMALVSCGAADPIASTVSSIDGETTIQNDQSPFALSSTASLGWMATSNTKLKLKPLDSSVLDSDEFCAIPKGTELEMSAYPIKSTNEHFKVFLTNRVPGCSFKIGYVFRPHFTTMPAEAPAIVNLNVPYFAQRNNKNEPSRTCNLTALAMGLQNLKIRVTPDDLFEDTWGRRNGETGAVFDSVDMTRIARQYGAKGSYMREQATAETIKQELRQGNAVVLQGYFSNWEIGHILLITGYDQTGWFLNDSAGKWNGNTGNDPYGANRFNGKNVHYTYSQVSANSLAGKNKYRISVVKK